MAPPDVLARAAVEIAERAEHAVFTDNARADAVIASALRRRRDLAPTDGRFISGAVFSLFRWYGWVEPLGRRPTEERLLFASLLDASTVTPPMRVWAQWSGHDPAGLVPLGGAPGWPARAEGFRRLVGLGRRTVTDPWRLFPDWLRKHLPLPPGTAAPKHRFVALLEALQQPAPLWVRAQGEEPEKLWEEMRAAGVKPWVHRRVRSAAKLDADVDVYHLPAFERGMLEIQDLGSQAVALVCDPDPGERWWDCCAGAGGKAIHLSSLMQGKGVVVATDPHPGRLREAVRRARRSPFRNMTTKTWDGKHVAGKPGSFDGVLVDAPCSGIGTWKRNPDARWRLDPEAVERLSKVQGEILQHASAGVRVGGTLVYSVCTFTTLETHGVIRAFLEAHPGFRLDPFPNPLGGPETDGTLQIWPQESDSDAMFIARIVRTV